LQLTSWLLSLIKEGMYLFKKLEMYMQYLYDNGKVPARATMFFVLAAQG
jgi:hypothetical protein